MYHQDSKGFKQETHQLGNRILSKKMKRMISIRLQGKPTNITIIQIYARTTEAEESVIDAFYMDLQQILDDVPKKDTDNPEQEEKQLDIAKHFGNRKEKARSESKWKQTRLRKGQRRISTCSKKGQRKTNYTRITRRKSMEQKI